MDKSVIYHYFSSEVFDLIIRNAQLDYQISTKQMII